jgi:HK97 family phage portal protein
MKFWKKKQETRAETQEEAAVSDLIQALIGKDEITKAMALEIATVSASINLIANIISSLPIRLYKKENDQTKVIEDDSRVKILNVDTGDTLTSTQFWKALIEDYYLDRGGYAYINRIGTHVNSIHYVSQEYVSIIKNTDPIFKDYDIYVNERRYHPHEFLKILKKSKDGCLSKSIVEENQLQLAIAYNSMMFENTLVKKGGNKKGFLQSAKKISREAIEYLKDGFRKLYGNNSENVVVLNDGVTFKESANTSVEMQLNENKETNSREITKLFGITPGMLNGTASTVEVDNAIKFGIAPLLKDIEASLNRDLLLESEKGIYYFAFDTREINRASIKERYEAYTTALKGHFLQIDEIRNMENMEPLGIDWVELGLNSVLYNPKTKEIYTPNTDSHQDLSKKGGKIDENRNSLGQHDED